MSSTFLVVVAVVNVVWFGLGFQFFTLQKRKAIRILVPRAQQDEMSARSLVDALPFLGGMNLAFATLSLCFLVPHFRAGTAMAWQLFAASGLAHATQWVHNLPHALRGGRQGGAPWDVLRGQMLLIFVVDAACASLNAGALVTSM